MRADKLQYELECVQRPGAEILIDGEPISPISFDFDPSNNTINIVTKGIPNDEDKEEDLEPIEVDLDTPVGGSEATKTETSSFGMGLSSFNK